MAGTPQVRLDEAVAEALQQRAIDSGRSLSAEANVWLRRALGLAPGQPSPAAIRNGAQPASIRAAQGRPPQPRAAASSFRGGWQGPPGR